MWISACSGTFRLTELFGLDYRPEAFKMLNVQTPTFRTPSLEQTKPERSAARFRLVSCRWP